MGRFRVNFYKDKGSYAAAFRTINSEAPTLENMNMPVVDEFIKEFIPSFQLTLDKLE